MGSRGGTWSAWGVGQSYLRRVGFGIEILKGEEEIEGGVGGDGRKARTLQVVEQHGRRPRDERELGVWEITHCLA